MSLAGPVPARAAVETGRLDDRLPYVRAGSGSRTLVAVPGLDDAMFDGSYPRAAGWALRWYFARFFDDREVLLVSRQRGLPDGHAIADMADDYAAALADRAPVDVVGFSMGGMVAQELAVRHPDLVDRVALANSGCRIADLDAVERFRSYAADRDWGAIRAELSAAMFTDWRAAAYPPVALTLGRFVPRPADPADVTVSLDAVEAFDAADRLPAVEPPALVFGGTADPYFPEPVLAETADRIPDSRRAFVRGAKHAAFHEHKGTFDGRLRAFLEGE